MSDDQDRAPRLSSPEARINAAFDAAVRGWRILIRDGADLAFPLPVHYVAPGGFFDWFFYWDSCFTVLGLTDSGEWELARDLVDGMIIEIEEFGHVPNYNSPQSVCMSRSQPPLLTTAILDVWPRVGDPAWLRRAVGAVVAEHETHWTTEPHQTDLGLSRFFDPSGEGCFTVPDTEHFRAMAESGWDNTNRFGENASKVVPIDLNSLLFRIESDLAHLHHILGDGAGVRRWSARAEERAQRINELCWDDELGWFHDLDLDTGRRLEGTPRSLASFLPLWAGLASPEQVARMVEHIPTFEAAHGLTATEPGIEDETEHSWPTGWAYSHWFVCDGLARRGYLDHSQRIALKWLRLVARIHHETGEFRERYNVVERAGPTPGRYPPPSGFAWTNAVFIALVVRVIFGQRRGGEHPHILPSQWQSTDLRFPHLDEDLQCLQVPD